MQPQGAIKISMKMIILFLGNAVARPGYEAIKQYLPKL